MTPATSDGSFTSSYRHSATWERPSDDERKPYSKTTFDRGTPAAAAQAAHRPKPDPAEARSGLIDAEKAFSDRAQAAGIGHAFTEKGRSDAINNAPPGVLIGPAAIGAAVSGGETGPSPVSWSADDAIVAPSGDLGVTFGMIRPNSPPPEGQPAAIPFFTIWMRDGPDQPWRYVAE